MWGSVVALESPLARQCPHWSCRDAFRGKSSGDRVAEGAWFDKWHEQDGETSALSPTKFANGSASGLREQKAAGKT